MPFSSVQHTIECSEHNAIIVGASMRYDCEAIYHGFLCGSRGTNTGSDRFLVQNNFSEQRILDSRGSDPLNSVSDLSQPRYGSRQGDFSGSVGFDLAGKFAEDQFL